MSSTDGIEISLEYFNTPNLFITSIRPLYSIIKLPGPVIIHDIVNVTVFYVFVRAKFAQILNLLLILTMKRILTLLTISSVLGSIGRDSEDIQPGRNPLTPRAAVIPRKHRHTPNTYSLFTIFTFE